MTREQRWEASELAAHRMFRARVTILCARLEQTPTEHPDHQANQRVASTLRRILRESS